MIYGDASGKLEVRYPTIPWHRLDSVIEKADSGSIKPQNKARVPDYTRDSGLRVFAGPMVWLARELGRYFPTEASLGGTYEVTAAEQRRTATTGSRGSARGLDGGWTPDLINDLLGGKAGEDAAEAVVLLLRIMFHAPGPPPNADDDYDRLTCLMLILPTWVLGALSGTKDDHQTVAYQKTRALYSGDPDEWDAWIAAALRNADQKASTTAQRSHRTPATRNEACRRSAAVGNMSKAFGALTTDAEFPRASTPQGRTILQQEYVRQLPGSRRRNEARPDDEAEQQQHARDKAESEGRKQAGGLRPWAARVVRQTRLLSITKAKQRHVDNANRFAVRDRGLAADPKLGTEEYLAGMENTAKGMCRQILTPTGWCRVGQRLDIVKNKQKLVEALQGIEFSALIKGGAACQTTLMRAAWGAGKVIFGSDISNGFPSILRKYLREALEEVCPNMLPMFDACYGVEIEVHDGDSVIMMPEGVVQGDSLSTILFDLAVARMHRRAVTRAIEIRRVRGGGDADDDAVVGWYTDDALGESPDVDTAIDYLEAFSDEMKFALAPGADTLSRADTAIACNGLTVQEIKAALKERDRLEWFAPDKIVGSDTPDEKRGFVALGVATGTDAFVRQHTANSIGRDLPGAPSAVRATKQLALLQNRAQLRFQLLRHCVAAKATHLRQQVSPSLLGPMVEPFTAAMDEELAAIVEARDTEQDSWTDQRGMPPAAQGFKLPERAKLRAQMPAGWGGCGIQNEGHEERCAAFVAAIATTAQNYHSLLAKMGGWSGPASSGYKWAQDLLVKATTLEEVEPQASESTSARTGSGGASEQISSGTSELLPLQEEFKHAYYTGVDSAVRWFKDLKDPELGMAHAMTSTYIVVAGRPDPIEIMLAVPPAPSDLRADAAKKHSKLQRSLSTVVALQRFFVKIWKTADAAEKHDLRELQLPRAASPISVIPSSKRFTFNEGAFPFMLRCRLGLEHGLIGPAVQVLEDKCNKRGGKSARGIEVIRFCERCRIRRHDAVGITVAEGCTLAGSGAVREAVGYLKCSQGSGVDPTLDVLQYWPGKRPVGLDIVVANCIDLKISPEAHLAEHAKFKRRGTGDITNLPAARAAHRHAYAALRMARVGGEQGARLKEAMEAERQARMDLTNAFRPGFEEAARRANTTFHPFNMSAVGGYGHGARDAIADMAHPGDLLAIGETGERFEAEDVVFNTRLHRHYLINSIAVSFWNATYSGAWDVVNGVPPYAPRTGAVHAGAGS